MKEELKKLKDGLSEISDRIIEGGELSDIVWQDADNNEDVIYYAKAEALIARSSQTKISEAEDELRGMYGDKPYAHCKTRNEVNTLLAFMITVANLNEEYREDIENDIEELSEFDDNLDEAIDKMTLKVEAFEDSEDSEDQILHEKFSDKLETLDEIRSEVQDMIDKLEDV